MAATSASAATPSAPARPFPAFSPSPTTHRWTRFGVLALVVLVSSVFVTLMSDDPSGIARVQTEIFFGRTAGDPWQYRALSQLIVQGFILVPTWLRPPSPLLLDLGPYHVMRLAQSILLLGLAYAYYRALGIRFHAAVAGLIVLAIMASLSLRPSTFSLDRFTDTIFYLLGGWLVVTGRTLALPLVVLLAALNRETSGFIALLPVAWFGRRLLERDRRRELAIVVLSLGVYTATFFGLRLYFGPPGPNGAAFQDAGFGISNFLFSLRRAGAPTHFFTAISVLPFLALLALPGAGPYLRRLYWLMIPAWFVVHFLTSMMQEGLLFLAPIAVALLPAVLRAVDAERADAEGAEAERGGAPDTGPSAPVRASRHLAPAG